VGFFYVVTGLFFDVTEEEFGGPQGVMNRIAPSGLSLVLRFTGLLHDHLLRVTVPLTLSTKQSTGNLSSVELQEDSQTAGE
jgi:hypothetical protein